MCTNLGKSCATKLNDKELSEAQAMTVSEKFQTLEFKRHLQRSLGPPSRPSCLMHLPHVQPELSQHKVLTVLQTASDHRSSTWQLMHQPLTQMAHSTNEFDSPDLTNKPKDLRLQLERKETLLVGPSNQTLVDGSSRKLSISHKP
jgi:hypothetical protein